MSKPTINNKNRLNLCAVSAAFSLLILHSSFALASTPVQPIAANNTLKLVPSASKRPNKPNTQSVLLTTRSKSNLPQNSTEHTVNSQRKPIQSPISNINAAADKINKAGNSLFSVGQYDQLLRRMVKNSTTKTIDADSTDIWEEVREGLRLRGYEQARVDAELNWFAKRQRYMDRVAIRATPFLFFVLNEVKQRDMPTEIALLPIVESAYQPFAFSSSRAAGLWQFIAETGVRYGLQLNWWYDGRRDIYRSTLAALDFLLDLHAQFDRDWLLALAAYNSGPGTVKRAIRKNLSLGKPTDFWSLHLPKETRDYVPKLLAISAIVAEPQAYNIKIKPIANEPYFKRVLIKKQIDLTLAAKLADISIQELYTLNPSFNQWATAPNGPHHLLVPVDKLYIFEQNLATLDPDDWHQWKQHTITEVETLGDIAVKYNTSTMLLKKVNNLSSSHISMGAKIIVPVNSYPTSVIADKPNKLKHHVVQKDETMWEVARFYKVKQRDLVKWNNLEPDAVLKPGQELVIKKKQRRLAKVKKSGAKKPVKNSNKKIDSNIVKASLNNTPPAPPIKRVDYEVRKGDSLTGLSDKFNVTVLQLQRWNDLDLNQLLKPGQNIRLYLHSSNLHANNI